MSIKEGLMALIDEQPRYGYELKTEFEAATGGVWKINVGQIYTTLDRLERDALVSVIEIDDAEGGNPQKHYSLTATGREHLAAWFNDVPTDEPPPREDLIVKVMMAIERNPTHGQTIITKQRSALFGILQKRRRADRMLTHASLADQLMSDALIVRTEADLRWLEQCEARIIQLTKQPVSPQEPIA